MKGSNKIRGDIPNPRTPFLVWTQSTHAPLQISGYFFEAKMVRRQARDVKEGNTIINL